MPAAEDPPENFRSCLVRTARLWRDAPDLPMLVASASPASREKRALRHDAAGAERIGGADPLGVLKRSLRRRLRPHPLGTCESGRAALQSRRRPATLQAVAELPAHDGIDHPRPESATLWRLRRRCATSFGPEDSQQYLVDLPAQAELAAAREGAVLGGVGGQFVGQHRDRQHRRRCRQAVVAVHGHELVARPAIRRQLTRGDLPQADSAPFAHCEQVVSTGQGRSSALTDHAAASIERPTRIQDRAARKTSLA
jgi:hypothetical protein